jgi:DNA-binding protein HU-beta
MNKTELIESIGGRLGDKKAAGAALDAVLSEIQSAVTKGDKVSITGFGVFERRERAARTARNPRTGEAVKVKKTAVPEFRPGAGFKEVVAVGRAPKATKAAVPASKSVAAKKTTATNAAPVKKATVTKTATKAKTAPAAAKRTPATTAARRPATVTKATKATKAPTKAPTKARATKAAR